MTLKEKIAELSRELRPMCNAKNRNLASEINSALMKHLDEHPEDRKAWFGHHEDQQEVYYDRNEEQSNR